MEKITKKRVMKLAWVSHGVQGRGYVLHVNPQDDAARPFSALHLAAFDNYRAALAIANAIRRHVTGA